MSVIIPALNEEMSLPMVLADLPAGLDVIVVDNGSTDATADVARRAGARVVHQARRGYGHACLAGLAVLAPTTRIVAFVDADHADYPQDLPHLLQPIEDGRADLVIASRMRTPSSRRAMPWYVRWGNRLAAWLMRIWYGLDVTDVGPFRAIRREALEQLQMEPASYRWTAEMMVKAARLGLRVAEVPGRYRARIGRSKISGTLSGTIGAACGILGTIARYRHWRPGRACRDVLQAPEMR